MQSLNRLKSDRPRRKHDFYETPYELCEAALRRLREDEVQNKEEFHLLNSCSNWAVMGIDAGCGKGVWGKAFREVFGNLSYLWGVEIQEGYTYGSEYDSIVRADYLMDFYTPVTYNDLVFGNPPYSLAEEFVRKSFHLASDNGYVFFLLRLAFLESKKRYFGLFKEHPPKRVYVLSRRPSFFSSDPEGKKKTTDAISYAMFLWQNGWEGKSELSWLYWMYDES